MKNIKVLNSSEDIQVDYNTEFNYDIDESLPEVEEEVLSPEEELELIQQEEIEDAGYRLEEQGKTTLVHFKLSNGTPVTLATPGGNQMAVVDRFVQSKTKYDKAGNKLQSPGQMDVMAILLRECIVGWGEKTRQLGESYIVTPPQILEDEWDFFRMCHGLEMAKPQRKPRSRKR